VDPIIRAWLALLAHRTTNQKKTPEWAEISRIMLIGRIIAQKTGLKNKDEDRWVINKTNVT
jgi:hypothetical protein